MIEELCKYCDYGERSEDTFIYCANPNRTIEDKTQSAEEGYVLVDREHRCTEWVPMPGADWDDYESMGAIE